MSTLEVTSSPLTKSSPSSSSSPPIDSKNQVECDLDIPIAILEGVKECTKHVIAWFLSYQNPYSKYKTLTASLSFKIIPKDIEDAFKNLRWREAINVEMKALRKNATWEVVSLLKEK